MAKKHSLQELLDLAGKFVADQKGQWDHDAWEGLLVKAEALGLELADENKRNLGNILEAAKYFYFCMPEEAPKKAAKPKATAKR
ncbi:MAG TPA: hypothetical protein PLI09_13480 [Candidatus Hydrogenedentes bacterium]|nr:hypothetical protein [Candidatus Hydrogenedentota bacterium]